MECWKCGGEGHPARLCTAGKHVSGGALLSGDKPPNWKAAKGNAKSLEAADGDSDGDAGCLEPGGNCVDLTGGFDLCVMDLHRPHQQQQQDAEGNLTCQKTTRRRMKRRRMERMSSPRRTFGWMQLHSAIQSSI